ncbi:hypothetical protein AB0J83_11545 [Actinoplanes sp. NPDC049596]|uniref:effector-associated constant component EACC1 n=1 Tax=unclassified Actinoplanes TaxID=2626549 RepID=UPI0034364FC9
MGELRVTAADGEDLLALRKWITESGQLRGVPVTVERAQPEPGTMPGSGAVEALVAVATDKATLTAIVSLIGGWATARLSMRRTRLKIKYGDREAEVDTARFRDPDELAVWLRRQLEPDGQSDES